MPEEAGAQVRLLTEQECLDVLSRGSIGRIACFSPSRDESYIVPTSFTYHPGAVYFASVPGQKLSFLNEHPHGICLEVEESNGGERATVVVTGDFEQLQAAPAGDAPAKRQPLRTTFGSGLSPYPQESLILCKLNIRKVSGRKDRWSWEVDFPLPLPEAEK